MLIYTNRPKLMRYSKKVLAIPTANADSLFRAIVSITLICFTENFVSKII